MSLLRFEDRTEMSVLMAADNVDISVDKFTDSEYTSALMLADKSFLTMSSKYV